MRLLPAIRCLFALSTGAAESGTRRIEKEVRHELVMLRNGHVTLRGAVASAADKNIAGIQANTLEGVFSVTNELSVDQARERKLP